MHQPQTLTHKLNYLDFWERKRQNYEIYRKLFQFYEDSYIGGIIYTDKADYMPRFSMLERKDEYETRRCLAAYDNNCYKYINNIRKHIFSKDIFRSGFDRIIAQSHFYSLANSRTSYENFISQLMTWTMVMGEQYVYVTADSTSDVVTDDTVRYSFHVIKPQNVLWFKKSEDGLLSEIVIEGEFVFAGKKYSKLYFNPDEIKAQRTEQDGKGGSDTFPNSFGYVPIFRVTLDENADGLGESVLRDIADKNKQIYNLRSLSIMINYKNAFPEKALPMSDDIQELYATHMSREEDTNAVSKIELDRARRVWPYPAGGTPPQNLSIDTANYTNIEDQIERLKRESDILMDQRIQQLVSQSGLAKSYDAKEQNSMLSWFAKVFEYLEKDLIVWVDTMAGFQIPEESISIVYPDEDSFDVIMTDKYYEDLKELYTMTKSAKGKKAIEVLLYKKLMTGLMPKDELDAILSDVKAIEDNEYMKSEMHHLYPDYNYSAGGVDDTNKEIL